MAQPSDPGAATRDLMSSATSSEMRSDGAGPLGLSPRQQRLNNLWAHYTGNCYDARKLDWNGQEHLDHLEHEVVAQQGFIPPGFVDSGQTLPLKFRRPTAPYYLVRVIVNRFTGLLFSARRHPKVQVTDDADTEDWLTAFCDATRLWSRFIAARRFGGGMGSAGVGFKFVEGRPHVEVHDPRWCEVEYSDEDNGELSRFEKRYMYPSETRDRATGQLIQGWFWYRRVIDAETDTVWSKVPAEDGEEPVWSKFAAKSVRHGLGFVPVVWIKNTDDPGEVDGTPDAQGIYDLVQAMDSLSSQAHKGALANMDPTLKVRTDDESPDSIGKGSDNALYIGKEDDASYLEITGQGIKLGMELAADHRTKALEVSRCVVDTNFGGPARTEAEVNGNYSTMIEAADELREQWGETGIKRLLHLVLRAARVLETARPVEQEGKPTRITRYVVKLPAKVVDGRRVPRVLGNGTEVELKWPPYFEPSVGDGLTATQAATQARQAHLIDAETATRAVAPYYGVEDVAKVVKAAQEEAAAEAGGVRSGVMGDGFQEDYGGEGA